jgi:hypothetical protein
MLRDAAKKEEDDSLFALGQKRYIVGGNSCNGRKSARATVLEKGNVK